MLPKFCELDRLFFEGIQSCISSSSSFGLHDTAATCKLNNMFFSLLHVDLNVLYMERVWLKTPNKSKALS